MLLPIFVPSSSSFYSFTFLFQGIHTELHSKGAKASSQIDKLQDILKSCPEKYSLKKDGLRLSPIPALGVVCNPNVDPSVDILRVHEEEGEEEMVGRGGYQPVSADKRGSLKRDRNMVPWQHHRSHSEGWRERHIRDFRYI